MRSNIKEGTEMIKRRNKHEWGVVGQCRNPYQEFHYCDLCKQYSECGDKPFISHAQFKAIVYGLSVTNNPMFDADSDTLYLDGRGSNWHLAPVVKI